MGVKNINPKEDALVVRSNKLIEANYETSLHQMRIMLWLISEIKPEDRDFQTYRVSIKELAKYVGVEANKNIYQQIAAATRGMIGRVVEIGSFDEDRLLQTGLISSAEYRVGEGFVDLSIDPKLKPYLLELSENFTKAYLQDLMQMKSAYSIRLYDLLNQYRKIGKRNLPVVEIKKTLGIEKKYKEYKNFKARVIKPAVDEINARTDLHIAFTERKHGRSVAVLEFSIQAKEGFRNSAPDRAGEFEDHDLTARLVGHGFKEAGARELVKLYGETDPERITFHIGELEKLLAADKVKRPVPWLRKAIEEDYREQKSLFQKDREEAEAEAQVRAAERNRRKEEAELLREQIAAINSGYDDYRIKFVEDLIAEVAEENRIEWQKEFVELLPEPIKRIWLKKPVWHSRVVLSKTEDFLKGKTGKVCLDSDIWAQENNKPDVNKLAEKRERLL